MFKAIKDPNKYDPLSPRNILAFGKLKRRKEIEIIICAVKKNKNKIKSNYHVSIVINLIFFALTIPAIMMKDNGMFCKYYSIIFFIVYFLSYKKANEKAK